MKRLITLMLLLGASHVYAAEVGQFFSPIGDSVMVRYTSGGQGKYHVIVETSKNGKSCYFDGLMEEWEEGDLRYQQGVCQLRVYQSNSRTLSVSEWGCEEFCEQGVNLRITRATKD